MQHRKGFTLIETVIYTALFIIGMTALVSVFITGLSTRTLISAEQRLIENQQIAELILVERLDEAATLSAPASGTGSVLTVSSPTSGENPVTFQVVDNMLTMTLGSGTPIPLTTSGVDVTAFSVTRLNGTPPTINIAITYETPSATGGTLSINSVFSYTLRYE